MVKRWPFVAVMALTSGCSAIIGFSDGEAI